MYAVSWFGPQSLAFIATFGALWSLFWNYAAFRRSLDRRTRTLFLSTAAFSAVFAIAWGWVAIDPDLDRGTWSEIVTPFSLMSFFIVWAGPAVLQYTQMDPIKQRGDEP